jgi:hypothetical protein
VLERYNDIVVCKAVVEGKEGVQRGEGGGFPIVSEVFLRDDMLGVQRGSKISESNYYQLGLKGPLEGIFEDGRKSGTKPHFMDIR